MDQHKFDSGFLALREKLTNIPEVPEECIVMVDKLTTAFARSEGRKLCPKHDYPVIMLDREIPKHGKIEKCRKCGYEDPSPQKLANRAALPKKVNSPYSQRMDRLRGRR